MRCRSPRIRRAPGVRRAQRMILHGSSSRAQGHDVVSGHRRAPGPAAGARLLRRAGDQLHRDLAGSAPTPPRWPSSTSSARCCGTGPLPGSPNRCPRAIVEPRRREMTSMPPSDTDVAKVAGPGRVPRTVYRPVLPLRAGTRPHAKTPRGRGQGGVSPACPAGAGVLRQLGWAVRRGACRPVAGSAQDRVGSWRWLVMSRW